MNRPQIRVTVNDGELKGHKGLIIGYDQNKWFKIKLDNGHEEFFKGFYLDGIEKLKPKHRYLLQDTNIEHRMSNLEIWKNYKHRTKPNVRRDFSIDMYNADIYFDNLQFHQLLSKIKYAMQNNFNFDITIGTYTYKSSSWQPLVRFDHITDTLFLHHHGKNEAKYLGTFERGIERVIYTYNQ